MFTRSVLGALTALLVIVVSPAAFAAKLVALSIGISGYEGKNYLSSPVKDATLVAESLADFGYQVRLVKDPDLATMKDEVDAFIEAARGADVAIVYFSGHGLQVNGEAYLVPRVGRPGESTAVSRIVERLNRAGVVFKFVIVDACRNNPYLDQDGNAREGAGVNAGAAERRQLGSHSLVAFASAPGQSAQDWGKHIGYSLYTAAFVDTLRKYQRIEVQQLMQQTRALVRSVSVKNGDAQDPWENSSMVRAVYFERVGGGSVNAGGTGLVAQVPGAAPDQGVRPRSHGPLPNH
jgi:uncharacterized caspase-like protein